MPILQRRVLQRLGSAQTLEKKEDGKKELHLFHSVAKGHGDGY